MRSAVRSEIFRNDYLVSIFSEGGGCKEELRYFTISRGPAIKHCIVGTEWGEVETFQKAKMKGWEKKKMGERKEKIGRHLLKLGIFKGGFGSMVRGLGGKRLLGGRQSYRGGNLQLQK